MLGPITQYSKYYDFRPALKLESIFEEEEELLINQTQNLGHGVYFSLYRFWSLICRYNEPDSEFGNNTYHLLEKNIDKANYFNWNKICQLSNPRAISLIENNLDKLKNGPWRHLSSNPNAVLILEKNIDKIHWREICFNNNPRALYIIENNVDKLDNVCWQLLCQYNNPRALYIIENNVDKLDSDCWHLLYLYQCNNPTALGIFEKNQELFEKNQELFEKNKQLFGRHSLFHGTSRDDEKQVEEINELFDKNKNKQLFGRQDEQNNMDSDCWVTLCQNVNGYDENAIRLIENNLDKLDENDCWYHLSENQRAIPILEKYLDKVVWCIVCANHNQDAIRLIEKNLDKLDNDSWIVLCENKNAVHIIEKNLDKAYNVHSSGYREYGDCGWTALTCNENPDAIHLLEKHPENINLFYIGENPNIFVDEYHVACKEYFKNHVTEELTKVVFHPTNIDKFQSWGWDDECEEE
jgi:hypothetical protein